MPRFFASEIRDGRAYLGPEERHHALRVMRLKAGDDCDIIVDGRIFKGIMTDAENGIVSVSDAPVPSPEPSVRFTLYQGLPKGDKMDMICQKCTEGGIYRIVPVLMERCVSRPDGKDMQKKCARWQRIMEEAAKQAGRAEVPQIELPVTVPALSERVREHELCLVPWEEAHGNSVSRAYSGQKDVGAVIGPEGGITPDEIARIGAVPVTLGPRIFRTETAGLVTLIEIMCLSGNLE